MVGAGGAAPLATSPLLSATVLQTAEEGSAGYDSVMSAGMTTRRRKGVR